MADKSLNVWHFFRGTGVEDVRKQLIDKTVDEQALREREAQWAYRLKTISPLGLNSDDFFSKRNPRRDLLK